MVSRRLRSLYLWQNDAQCPFDRKLGEPEFESECCDREVCACPTEICEILVTNFTMVTSVSIITFVLVAKSVTAIQSNSDISKLFLSYLINGTSTDVISR